jgi:hypothetical protein
MESEMVDHNELERTRGFLVYVASTYKPLTTFLPGLHLTIDSWRPGRDEEGWWLRQVEVDASMGSDEDSDGGWEKADAATPPRLVEGVPRLWDYLDVRIQLTGAEAPLLRWVRASRKAQIMYCYGDASGSGFGWCIDFDNGVRYELGEWCDNIQE